MFGLTLGILSFCLLHQVTVPAPITNIDGIIDLAVATAAKSLLESNPGMTTLHRRGEEAVPNNTGNLSPRDDSSAQGFPRTNPAVHLARRGVWPVDSHIQAPSYFNDGYGPWNSVDGWALDDYDYPGFAGYPYGGDYAYPYTIWGGQSGWDW
ncbi:hypothetical protein IWQ62_000785 [Dispira parvispora]|uniref:Uncharacterized protein n=1 Tax=Dispira parvispora TaxID=1520584 RepID=A0A9W8AU26_9FUNG|nr:hypothetical protein IWQ62_000785 [Dispira parvispora]